MKIITSLPLLIFVGCFHFESTDGFPDIGKDRVAALFTGGAVIEGEIKIVTVVPAWMRPGSPSWPDIYAAYIRTSNNDQYESILENYPVVSLNHDPQNPEHGPTYAEIRLKNEHYTAKNFYVHIKPKEDYRWNVLHMPRNNEIYIALPSGVIYQSQLEPHQAHHRPAQK